MTYKLPNTCPTSKMFTPLKTEKTALQNKFSCRHTRTTFQHDSLSKLQQVVRVSTQPRATHFLLHPPSSLGSQAKNFSASSSLRHLREFRPTVSAAPHTKFHDTGRSFNYSLIHWQCPTPTIISSAWTDCRPLVLCARDLYGYNCWLINKCLTGNCCSHLNKLSTDTVGEEWERSGSVE